MSADNEADKQVEASSPNRTTTKVGNKDSKRKASQSQFEWHVDQSDAEWEDARRLRPSSTVQKSPPLWRSGRFYWILGLVGVVLFFYPWKGRISSPAESTPIPTSRAAKAYFVALPPPTRTPPVTKKMLWFTHGGLDPFFRPSKLRLDLQGNIYLVDAGNHRIEKLDPNGNPLFLLGKRGSQDGDFWFYVLPPIYGALDIDASGNLFVADHNNRIQKFDATGAFLMKFGSTGEGDGQFQSLAALAIDSQGVIYASDWGTGLIQAFDHAGKFLRKWRVLGCAGKGVGSPEGLVATRLGHILMVNSAGDCVQEFDGTGTLLAQWGESGRSDGELLHPVDLTLDAEGNVYIADQENFRVQKFDANGHFLEKWGPFEYPGGVAVDSNGNVYVTEVLAGSLNKFQPK